jgi:glycosyltransferase involved in cell wall biosynthesis
MYFYWGVGSSQLIPFLQKNKAKKVIRFHGEWDLWEESSGGAIPLREEVLKAIDLAVFISLKGKEYFHHRYRNLEPKSIVSYLGTKDYGYAERSSDGIIRLLSCSSLIPLKRVGLIIDSIQTIKNQKVEWTHIGDGPEMLELINKSNSLNPNIKVNIIGRLSNQEVINYYINNKIDVFINVSSIEGLPVTMMESISFNVPIIATDVGGVSELVNSETGILLKPNPNTEEIAEAIINIGLNNLNPKSFWNRKFNADINYPRFIEVIKTLS